MSKNPVSPKHHLPTFVKPLAVIASTVILCTSLILVFIFNRGPVGPKELPSFKISLNGITLQDFQQGDKKTKYKGNSVDFINDEKTTTYSDVEVRGRGNSTWGLPKPPFQIKFSESIDLLSLGEAKTWVLLANYVDHSNLRNDIAFKLADMLGEKYATRGEFVKVFVDDGYLGIYYLTHKMEAKKGSVALKDDYGVLMEIDNIHRATENCIETSHNTCMTVKDTVADEDGEEEVYEAAIQAFMDDYNKYEAAVTAKDYDALTEIIDVESFAEYFIISELSSNPDAYSSSVYFYKDGLDDKIHAGPIWDYDYAFANPGWVWGDSDKVFSPYETTPFRKPSDSGDGKDDLKTSTEYYNLIDMPEFVAEVKGVFKEKLSGRGAELISWIEGRAELIREETLSDADRWVFDDVIEDTENLIDWVRRRFDYVEYIYGR